MKRIGNRKKKKKKNEIYKKNLTWISGHHKRETNELPCVVLLNAQR